MGTSFFGHSITLLLPPATVFASQPVESELHGNFYFCLPVLAVPIALAPNPHSCAVPRSRIVQYQDERCSLSPASTLESQAYPVYAPPYLFSLSIAMLSFSTSPSSRLPLRPSSLASALPSSVSPRLLQFPFPNRLTLNLQPRGSLY